VHDGAGVTAHRWLKATFAKLNLVKATFSRYRTASEAGYLTGLTGTISPTNPYHSRVVRAADRLPSGHG